MLLIVKSKQHAKKAFTFIELLIALIIFTLLLSLTFPALQLAFNSAKKTEAITFISTLRSALLQYRTEYGDWPEALTNYIDANGDISIGDNQWGEVYRCLSGYTNSADGYLAENGSTNNIRHLVFMEFQSSSLSSSENPPYAGDEMNPSAVKNIIDPWLHPYHLLLDANNDHQLAIPNASQPLQSSIAIWSVGSDTNRSSSYIISWK